MMNQKINTNCKKETLLTGQICFPLRIGGTCRYYRNRITFHYNFYGLTHSGSICRWCGI